MSNHRRMTQIRVLREAFGGTWTARGYNLTTGDAGISVSGDFGQFYCDAVADDAHAAILAELLRSAGSPDWDSLVEMAEEDGIDMVESQDTLLRGKSLEDCVEGLSAEHDAG